MKKASSTTHYSLFTTFHKKISDKALPMTSTDDPLVSTDWLAAHIDDPKVRIIDASFKLPGVLPLPADDYQKAHIPGAVFFNVYEIAASEVSLPHMYPDAKKFAHEVAALGISTGDTV